MFSDLSCQRSDVASMTKHFVTCNLQVKN